MLRELDILLSCPDTLTICFATRTPNQESPRAVTSLCGE